jgi:hypothetical protein
MKEIKHVAQVEYLETGTEFLFNGVKYLKVEGKAIRLITEEDIEDFMGMRDGKNVH